MSRRARCWRPGTGQHLISRFVDRQFRILDEADRAAYLHFYGEAQSRWDWRPLAYVLMNSHVHHAALAGKKPLDRVFRSVHTRYAGHCRVRYGTVGPVFASRPKNYEKRRSQLRELVAYIHLNPVDAGVCSAPAESSWSSHLCFLRLAPSPSWLDVEFVLDLLGFEDTQAGRRRFDEFVRTADLTEFRRTHLGSRQIHDDLGGDLVRAQFEYELSTAQWQLLISMAALEVGIVPADVVSSRSHTAAGARRIVGTVARQLGQSYTDIARRLGRRVSSVHRLLNRPPRDPDVLREQCRSVLARITNPR